MRVDVPEGRREQQPERFEVVIMSVRQQNRSDGRALAYLLKEAYPDVSVEPVNLEYAVKSCIFGFSNSSTNNSGTTSNICTKECGGIQTLLPVKYSQGNASLYQYCLDSSPFLTDADQCSGCLSNQKNKIVLANCMSFYSSPSGALLVIKV
jgi:hypothetical protein